MNHLPLTHRQRTVLGRIYSFQCSTNEDGSQGEYRMSIANGAKELGIDRDSMKIDLQRLTELGFTVKCSNGERRPSTRLVDEVVCITEARRTALLTKPESVSPTVVAPSEMRSRSLMVTHAAAQTVQSDSTRGACGTSTRGPAARGRTAGSRE